MRIISWNINQRSGYYNRNVEIPNLVIAELTRQNADVIVLNEYKHCKSFEDILCGMGYFILTDKNPLGNEILIAVKKNCLNCIRSEIVYPQNKGDNWPNFLHVEAQLYGISVTIIGIRIRRDDFVSQFKKIKEHLNTIDKNKNVICVGDFNAWSSRIKNKYGLPDGYYILTPTVDEKAPIELKSCFIDNDTKEMIYKQYKWSFVHENGDRSPLDHIIYKGFHEPIIDYSWKFRELQPSIYKNENGNDVYNQYPPYPDHAILSAIVELPIANQ